MLKVNEYRGFIIKFIVFFIAILSIFLIVCGVSTIWDKSNETLMCFFCAIIIDVLLICLALLLKFCRGTFFTFTEDEICSYKKDGSLQETIAKKDVESIIYFAFHYRYIGSVITLAGELPYGAWKLVIKLHDGNVRILKLIGLKDARKIKEFYGDIVEIR